MNYIGDSSKPQQGIRVKIVFTDGSSEVFHGFHQLSHYDRYMKVRTHDNGEHLLVPYHAVKSIHCVTETLPE